MNSGGGSITCSVICANCLEPLAWDKCGKTWFHDNNKDNRKCPAIKVVAGEVR